MLPGILCYGQFGECPIFLLPPNDRFNALGFYELRMEMAILEGVSHFLTVGPNQ